MSTPSNGLNISVGGLVVFDGNYTFLGRTLVGGTGISITNANGVTGNPMITFTGSSGIGTINGDSGSITGATVTVFTNNTTNNSGSTFKFVNSGTTSTLNVTDAHATTMIGNATGKVGGTANGNTGFGYAVLTGVTGGQNTGVGASTLTAIVAGGSNTAIGFQAMAAAVSCNQCTAIGNQTLSNYTGASTETAIGNQALASDVTGTGNTGCGNGALYSDTAPYLNTAVGVGAGFYGQGCQYNTYVGYNAGYSQAASANTYNTCIGYYSGISFNGAADNAYVGRESGRSNATGNHNTAIGSYSFRNNASGSDNISIGYTSCINYTTSESSNIIIGNAGTASESNVIRLGTGGSGAGQQSTCYIAGISGVTVTGTAVLCSATGQLGTIASSIRYKDNVKGMPEDVSVMNLRPVQFNYKSAPNQLQYGLIAEEVEKDFPYLCFLDAEGRPESVKYHELPILLLKEIQRLSKRIESLEKTIK